MAKQYVLVQVNKAMADRIIAWYTAEVAAEPSGMQRLLLLLESVPVALAQQALEE